MKTITFTIKGGEVKTETKGFTGKACQLASKPYLDALGGAETEKLTPEYYTKPVANKLKVGQ